MCGYAAAFISTCYYNRGRIATSTRTKTRFYGENIVWAVLVYVELYAVDTGRYGALRGTTGCYATLRGATVRYGVLRGTTRRYGALRGATRCYGALRGATALRDATRCYAMLRRYGVLRERNAKRDRALRGVTVHVT
jgi:hypothetical protein